MRVGIIGGGFAGLAAAIAFRDNGHDVLVFEKDAQATGASAGIVVARNALRCLDILGVRGTLNTGPWSRLPATVRNRSGRVLVRRPLAHLTGGDEVVVVLRSRLLDILTAQLPDAVVRRRCAVTEVRTDGRVTADGHDHRFDLVVAADGARGIVRTALWPDAVRLRRTDIHGWSWVVDQTLTSGFGSIWGETSDFGILPLDDGRAYAYGSTCAAGAQPHDYLDWPDPLPALITAATRFTGVTVCEMPPPRQLARGRVVLIGDAAHAMRPTFGQGAALAMEDAITLAYSGVEQLTRRRMRMTALYWMSRGGSLVSAPRRRLLADARDAAVRLTPDPLFATLAGAASRELGARRPPTAR